jgi:hypothetical protein
MKKQNKWLDNYGKADNANESNVSLSENFVGLGYNTNGRNYSPAWGGQFEDGGIIPVAQKGIQQDVTRVDNNAVDRIWGIQRQIDSEKLNRDDFQEKYGMSLHQFKMRDIDYASAFQRQMEQRRQQDPNYGEINLPQTDVRSKIYQGNPNLAFLPGTSEGQSRAALEDAFLATTTLSAPLLPINTAKLGQFSNLVGDYLTTQTPLKNTYNLLPEGTFTGYSKLKNPEKSYRVAGMDAYDDFVESGVLRSRNTQPGKIVEDTNFVLPPRPTSFPSFQKGYADLSYLPEEGGVVFETSLPTFKRGQINPVTGVPISGRHYAHRVIDPETGATLTSVPGENINVYTGQPNWLRGYKQIDIPKKELGGSIPGSVGFTYARTAGSVPSEGKYAKKTLPSALNGKEMQFYQEGLDWKPKSMQDGGIVEDDMGYWNPDNRAKPVRINSNLITMEGVYEPLLGIDDTGDTKLMLPGENYKFKGKKVTEFPLVAQRGITVPTVEGDALPEVLVTDMPDRISKQNEIIQKTSPKKNYSIVDKKNNYIYYFSPKGEKIGTEPVNLYP